MSCPTCNDNTPLSFDVQSFINSSCLSTSDSCVPSSKICYTGGNLICSGILTNDDLGVALTKLDSQICSMSGDYSTYQKNCLPTWFGSAINTEAIFVNAMTSYACEIATNLQTFTGTTFPQYQSSVTAQLGDITGPSLTCTSAGVTTVDNLFTILTKYCSLFSTIKTDINLSNVNFGNCFTTTQPVTIHQGFVAVLDQICQVKTLAQSGGTTLPTFNNVGSCLPLPLTTTDSLTTTIEKIKTRLCQTPTYDYTLVSWGCSSPDAPSLEDAFNSIATNLTYTMSNLPTFGTGFTSVDKVPGSPCQGKLITLDPLVDRLVAATATDTTPGTLEDKLLGDGIIIDNAVPTKITLRSDRKILSSSTDTSPNYLINKLNGGSSNGISVTPTYNINTEKVDLVVNIDKNLLCQLVNSCVNPVCSNYLITPTSANSNVSYYACDGTVQYITISSATNICAKINTPYCPTATIENTGECASLTNSKFVLTNTITQATITTVDSGGASFTVPTYNSFPLVGSPSSVLIGNGTTSGPVRVNITMSTPTSSALTLLKNSVAQQSITVSNTGAYIFTAVTFLPGDEMKIILDSNT